MTRTLLVTGGSAGIGAATARMAPAKGWEQVIVHYARDAEGAEAVARDIRAAGAQAQCLQADVANPDDITAMFTAISGMSSGPLGLVNNAGIVSPKGTIADRTPDRVRHVFEVNVFGAIEVLRQGVDLMRNWGQGGGIVNVSSAAARLGSHNEYIDYAATKGAIDTLTLGLADELAPEGIRVNAIRPGLIDTDIHAKGGQPDRLARISPNLPMKRPGSAEECAQAILWLLSDEASYVTRTIVDVAGGR